LDGGHGSAVAAWKLVAASAVVVVGIANVIRSADAADGDDAVAAAHVASVPHRTRS
jgi:hypothetical protein